MGLWSYRRVRKHRALDGRDVPRGMGEALFASHLNAGEECEYLRQATNLIQIKSRMIAPMIDMMKPAG